jgi:hypothetical protein
MARTKALTCYGMSYRGACSLLLVIAQAACVGWCDIHANARPLVGGYYVTNADGDRRAVLRGRLASQK